MTECENVTCTNEAYATVRMTDPNSHADEHDLCGNCREEVYEGSTYDCETVEKLKKERTAW